MEEAGHDREGAGAAFPETCTGRDRRGTINSRMIDIRMVDTRMAGTRMVDTRKVERTRRRSRVGSRAPSSGQGEGHRPLCGSAPCIAPSG